jgi:uncharacterized delta-60 repeat protein
MNRYHAIRFLLSTALAAALTVVVIPPPLVAAAGAGPGTITLVSGTEWRTKSGFAQHVCLNAFSPPSCPSGGTVYGHPAAGWQADLGAIPGAAWIWAPSIDGSTPGADGAAFAFRKTLNLPARPTAGMIHVAADDLARIVINGSAVGEWGSVTDQQAAGNAQNNLASFDIAPFLRKGKNVVVVIGHNGPASFAGCAAPCTYAENPAGVVFGGTITLPTAPPPGALDPTFGASGLVITDFGASFGAEGMTLQADGKVVAVGTSNGDFAVTRYLPNGDLDPQFDTDGKVTTDFGRDDGAQAVAIRSDGKIVVVGYSAAFPEGDIAIARYNPDGSLDTAFDADGRATTDFGGYEVPNAVALQPDGKVVVGGFRFGPSGDDWILGRYLGDGRLDVSFDGDGRVVTDFGAAPFERLGEVLVQTDGRIVGAGSVGDDDHFALARYLEDGSLDPSFGVGGMVTTHFGFPAAGRDATLQSDGKILLIGTSGDFVLARYLVDGSLDPSFGSAGVAMTDFGAFEHAAAVAMQPDGRFVIVGYHSPTGANELDFAIARYLGDGSLDTGFDGDGKVTTDLGASDSAHDVAIQPDGRVVVAGVSGDDFAVARYLG